MPGTALATGSRSLSDCLCVLKYLHAKWRKGRIHAGMAADKTEVFPMGMGFSAPSPCWELGKGWTPGPTSHHAPYPAGHTETRGGDSGQPSPVLKVSFLSAFCSKRAAAGCTP